MRVQIIRTQSLQAVGPHGPVTRVFNVGDIVDLDDLQARIFIAQQDAVEASDKPVKVVEDQPKSTKASAKKSR